MAFRSRFLLFLFLVVFLSSSLVYLNLGLTDFFPSSISRPKYPSAIPDKFDPDGNVQLFRGNGIISHLSNSSELYSSLLVFYEQLKQSSLAHVLALLPPSSWHMTVFEGAVDKERRPGYWPIELVNATLEECTAEYEKRLSTFDLQTELPYHISIVGLTPTGLGLHLEPHTADNKALRHLRDRLSALLGIRHPDHEYYGLHLSLGYRLRYFTKKQDEELANLFKDYSVHMPKEFELGAPALCTFEDMYAYEPILYLKNRPN